MSDLHDKSMDILHEAAGIKRDGLAGLLAWIEDRKADRAEADRLRAKLADPEARLRALKVLWGEHNKCGCADCLRVGTVCDTRVKNWRKP